MTGVPFIFNLHRCSLRSLISPQPGLLQLVDENGAAADAIGWCGPNVEPTGGGVGGHAWRA